MNKYLMCLVIALVLVAGTAQATILPTCSNATCTTSCGYAGGLVTNGRYDLINHSPWLVCKTKLCPATLPCPVNCVEHLSDCSATCGAGVQTPIVDTPASNGGTECVLVEQTCNLGDCAVIPAEATCLTECGLQESYVADGQGGLTKHCDATNACVQPTPTPEPTPTPTPEPKHESNSSSGDFVGRLNPRNWIITQIHFLEYKIEQLQKQLQAIM